MKNRIIIKFLIIMCFVFFTQNANAQVFERLAQNTTFEKSKSDCDNGDAISCAVHGYFYTKRGENADNLRFSADYYEKSCNLNSGLGCFGIAASYEKGWGRELNFQTALAKFNQSCELGYDDACINLGQKYYNGNGVIADREMAYQYFSKGCTTSMIRSCFFQRSLGIQLNKPEVHNYRIPEQSPFQNDNELAAIALIWQNGNYILANSTLNNFCNNGKPYACVILGESYFNGLGVRKDYKKAADYYEIGCKNGSFDGCNGLGNAFANGEGREKDENIANNHYRTACDGGVMDGCFNIAVSIIGETNANKDLKLASELLYDSCKYSHIGACHNLGILFLQQGNNFDEAMARRFLNAALSIDPNFTPSANALSRLDNHRQ